MTPTIPPSLLRNLRERRCVLFAGAGLSAWAGLPTWRRLLEDTIEVVRNETFEDDGGELDRMIERGKYLELADHCRQRLGPRYTELLAERLRADDGVIPDVHRIVIRLPFAGWVTTNYDKLLERAYAEERGGWPKTLTHMDADSLGMVLFDRAPFILKAHGDIDKPSSIVLTTGDYREIIHANPAFNAVFSAILLTHAVLFVGYSLSDPDFRLLLDRQLTAFRNFVPDRYAIMQDVGEVEREVLFRSARIRVISYEGDHAWLLEFLKALENELGTAAAPAPQAGKTPPREQRRTRSGDRGARTRGTGTRGTGTRGAPVTGQPTPEPPTVALAVPGRDASEFALTLAFRSRRVEARLVDPHGQTLSQGTGPEIDWSWVVRLTSLVHTEYATVRVASIGDGLAAQLPREVLAALSQPALAGNGATVRLVLDADLEALPWEATTVNGVALALRVALVRAPITVSDDARGVPAVRSPGRALLIGDPGTGPNTRLPGAQREVERIAKLLMESGFDCTTLLRADATAEAVLKHLQSRPHDVVHFAGHAWYDDFDVYLMLAGSERLTSAELRQVIARQPPPLVFLDSHYTAFLPPGTKPVTTGSLTSPDAVRTTALGRSGFAEDMMRSGVGAFIGCWGSPTDMGAADFATTVYDRLLKGDRVAVAVHEARRTVHEALTNDATPLLFSLSGYGSLRLS